MGRQLAVIVFLVVLPFTLLPAALPAQGVFAPVLPDHGVADDVCFLEGELLCLQGGRYRAQVRWRDFRGNTGVGKSVKLTFETGYFWFFGRGNAEIMLKVLDGRAINGHFWVFYGSLSNVEFTITVTDVLTGAQRVYFNPGGQFASLGDVAAFPAEPKCGGFAGVGCPGEAICDFPPGQCGFADHQGTCVPRPDVCPEIFAPVCGCDGVTYGNDCERLRAGVALDHDGECGG
jgi:hypothetical protein